MPSTYGRSPAEIAEDMVLTMASPVINVNRADAVRHQIQRREVLQADARLPDLRQREAHDGGARHAAGLVRKGGWQHLHIQAGLLA